MSSLRQFTEQSHEQVIRSVVNNSTSKSSWTFSKQKRFIQPETICQEVMYAKNYSTISNKKSQFGNSRRRLFTQISEAPTSWLYHPKIQKNQKSVLLAEGRQKCRANTYICSEIIKNPGPGKYIPEKESLRGKTYSMRPQTAKHRTYFIQNKEQTDVPGPGQYKDTTCKVSGNTNLSKFKSTVLGNSGLENKTTRFKDNRYPTPSPLVYLPNDCCLRKNGGQIGQDNRLSFIDKEQKNSYTPGPGLYKLPSEFGHYKKM